MIEGLSTSPVNRFVHPSSQVDKPTTKETNCLQIQQLEEKLLTLRMELEKSEIIIQGLNGKIKNRELEQHEEFQRINIELERRNDELELHINDITTEFQQQVKLLTRSNRTLESTIKQHNQEKFNQTIEEILKIRLIDLTTDKK